MKKVNQLAKKKLLQIYLYRIKTKVAITFPNFFFFFFFAENQLAVERVKFLVILAKTSKRNVRESL